MRNVFVAVIVCSMLALACDSSNGSGPAPPDATAPDTVHLDVLPDTDPTPPPDVPAVDDAVPGEDDVIPGDEDVVPGEDAPAPDVAPDTAEDVEEPTDLPPFDDVDFPPRKLAFPFERPPVGDPVSTEDVTAFTRRVAATLHEVGYFRWLLRTSTGVDPSTGREDYLAWHNDIRAVKSGDTVTFQHVGHEHNMWINSSKVLSAVMGAYLHTGQWEAAKLTEQYCKGLTAVVKGFIWGEDDPAPWLMARAIFPGDHDFTMDAETWQDDGRRKGVEFSHAKTEARNWNCDTFAWPENPAWGSIWVTNMRSKDDVRAISRLVPFLHYVVEDAEDEWVKAACGETLDTMIHFHKDIVDEEYFIRTKDDQGVAMRLPCTDQKDLGSYVCFTPIDPRNECCARLSADMIAYGERLTNDCGTCTGSVFDQFASTAHAYNIPIIWDYHMAGLVSSLVARQHVDAYHTMVGLAERIDSYIHPIPSEPGINDPRWPSRTAYLLVEAAAVGLPLTAHEVRHIHQHWLQAVTELEAWDKWDLWDESIPDGTYSGGNLRPPTSNDAIPVQYFATLFEYCMSPFQNPAGEAFVDCDVLRDPSTWAPEE